MRLRASIWRRSSADMKPRIIGRCVESKPPLSLEAIPARLEGFLARHLGAPVRVEGPRALAGGASRAAIALDITVADGPQAGSYPAVLRLDLGGNIYATTLGREEESPVPPHAARGGVPVPEPLWTASDPAVLARDFLILARVEGETIGRRIVQLPELAAARQELPRQMGRALARIHALDPAPLAFLPRPDRGSAALSVLARARAELDRAGGARPGLE